MPSNVTLPTSNTNAFINIVAKSKTSFFFKQLILDSSKLKEVSDDNFKFDENGRDFSKRVENTAKRRNCSL